MTTQSQEKQYNLGGGGKPGNKFSVQQPSSFLVLQKLPLPNDVKQNMEKTINTQTKTQ